MSVKKRFMEHLEAKGKIPKGYACGGMAKGYNGGGEVENDDDYSLEASGEWQDAGWNFHKDTSGEPAMYMSKGGMVPDENFPGPKHSSQVDDGMSEQEIRSHMVKAIKARRGRY